MRAGSVALDEDDGNRTSSKRDIVDALVGARANAGAVAKASAGPGVERAGEPKLLGVLLRGAELAVAEVDDALQGRGFSERPS